jgi:hypothetical protein
MEYDAGAGGIDKRLLHGKGHKNIIIKINYSKALKVEKVSAQPSKTVIYLPVVNKRTSPLPRYFTKQRQL